MWTFSLLQDLLVESLLPSSTPLKIRTLQEVRKLAYQNNFWDYIFIDKFNFSE